MLAFLCGCSEVAEGPLVDDVFTGAEWQALETLSGEHTAAPDPTNRFADDTRAASLGQRLFADTRLSGPLIVASELGAVGDVGKVSCATCHDPLAELSDPRVDRQVSVGTGVTRRNSPSLVDGSANVWFGWGGAHDVEWKLAATVIESASVLDGNRLALAHLMYDSYRTEYDALFPVALDPALSPSAIDASRFPPAGKPKAPGSADGPWEMMTPEDRVIVTRILANCGKAIAAYDRTLQSGPSPFDRYVAGDRGALSLAAKRGAQLFVGKAACITCHSGPRLTDNMFHDTAVAQTASPQDLGRLDDIPKLASELNGAGPYSDAPDAGAAKLVGVTATDDVRGQFRTPALRSLGETAPYMHDGSIATLADVVAFYNRGGAATGFPGIRDVAMVPLGLSADEAADLVAFLQSLDGAAVQ
jgi:cytochrome c peroxidase